MSLVDERSDFIGERGNFPQSFADWLFCFQNGQALAGAFDETGAFADVAVENMPLMLLQSA